MVATGTAEMVPTASAAVIVTMVMDVGGGGGDECNSDSGGIGDSGDSSGRVPLPSQATVDSSPSMKTCSSPPRCSPIGILPRTGSQTNEPGGSRDLVAGHGMVESFVTEKV